MIIGWGGFGRLFGGLDIPPKVRHFAWRACKDILPTKENLMRRKVLLDGQYKVCHGDVQSSGHIFWDYAFIREVWEALKLFPLNSRVHFHSFMDLLWYGIWKQIRSRPRLNGLLWWLGQFGLTKTSSELVVSRNQVNRWLMMLWSSWWNSRNLIVLPLVWAQQPNLAGLLLRLPSTRLMLMAPYLLFKSRRALV